LDHPVFGNDANEDGVRDRIVYRENFVVPEWDATDEDGFGTTLAGVIAEMAPGVNLIILEVFHPTGAAAGDANASALQWVYNNRMNHNIVAALIGINEDAVYTAPEVAGENATDFVNALHPKLALLDSVDIPVVTASGDVFKTYNSLEGLTYPAASPLVISVGGVWDKDEGEQPGYDEPQYTAPDQIMARTNRDPEMIDLFAPGALIYAADPYPGAVDYRADQIGTGLAAAHVAAAIALAQHMNEEISDVRLSNDELEALLKDTAKSIFDGEDFDTPEELTVVDPTDDYYKRLDVEAMAYKLFKPATAPDLVAGSDWGFSNTDNKTGDTTPTFTGSAPPNSHVWLYIGSTEIANGAANGSGVYTLTASSRRLSPVRGRSRSRSRRAAQFRWRTVRNPRRR
jgi:hypothetical protein